MDIRVSGNTASELVAVVKSNESASPRVPHMFLFSANTASDRTSGPSLASPFRLLPDHADAGGFRSGTLVALFGEARPPAKSPSSWVVPARFPPQPTHLLMCTRAQAQTEDDPAAAEARLEQCLFAKEDILILADGRRPSTLGAYMKELNKSLKGFDAAKKGKQWPLRLLHSNREFERGQYAAPRRRASPQLGVPEPLETLLMCPGTKYGVPVRPRLHLDLPGDNAARGMSGISLRPELTYKIMVTVGMKKEVLRGIPKTGGSLEDLGSMILGEEDDVAEESQPAQALSDSDPTPLFPWEANEKLFRELLNMYGQKPACRIVDFTPGQSSAPLAAAREHVQYLGIVRSAAQARIIKQTCIALIMTELVDQVHDGFFLRRFLSRARSLGAGTSAPTESDAPQDEAVRGEGQGGADPVGSEGAGAAGDNDANESSSSSD